MEQSTRRDKLTLETRRDGDALRFYERHGWRVAYVMENHFLRRDYAGMVKEPNKACGS